MLYSAPDHSGKVPSFEGYRGGRTNMLLKKDKNVRNLQAVGVTSTSLLGVVYRWWVEAYMWSG